MWPQHKRASAATSVQGDSIREKPHIPTGRLSAAGQLLLHCFAQDCFENKKTESRHSQT